MVVNRQQHSDVHQYQEIPPIPKPLPKLNIALRAQCLMIVVLVAIGAMYITIRSENIIRAGYDLVQLKSESLSLQKENALLQLEIAKLKSPQRIQSIATTELGMVKPNNVYYATGSQPITESGKSRAVTPLKSSKIQ